MAYDKKTDYSDLIKQAVASGDYIKAAQYEQQRNEKIAGEGMTQYEPTNTYSSWLNFDGSATDVATYGTNQEAIKAQMNANSKAWHGADKDTQASLHAQNVYLASLLGEGVTYDGVTGSWSGAADKPAAVQYATAVQPTFDYPSYQETNPQPTYESDYSARIDEMLNKLLNRDAFSYNAENDPMFQQLRTQYNREGNRAMTDTLANLASSAGGMNSYAVTTAQQANDYYSSQLMDRIPELYQLAYDMYLTDIDNQVRDLGLLQEMDDNQYGRYRDTMSDWRDDRNFVYNQYRDDMGDYRWDTEFNYNAARDEVADKRYDTEWEYNTGVEQDEISYNRVMDQLYMGVMPSAAELEAAGLSTQQAQAIIDASTKQQDLENGRYDNETAYNRVMDKLAMGVMPSSSELAAAGITASQAQAILAQAQADTGDGGDGVIGDAGMSGAVNGALQGVTGPDEPSGDELLAPVTGYNTSALGADIPRAVIGALYSAGGVNIDNSGNVKWASGWNKNNYMKKLQDEMTTNTFMTFNG